MSIKKTSLLIFLFAVLICFTVVGCASAASVPSANFTSNVTNGTGNLSVQFNDSSTGNPSFWTWNFGDNQTSTEQNPTHNYTSPGNYTVSLTATNAIGNNTIYKTNYIWMYSSAAENRFNNSGFETGTLDGWTSGSTTTISNTQSHTGGNSAQFSSSGTQDTNSLEQNIDLTLVDSISFWGYGENTTNSFYVYIDGKRTSFKAVSNTWTQYTLSTLGYTGVHNITIKWLKGANAYVDEFTTEITKNSANFISETINNPSEPLTVQFNDTSMGLITSWAWDFDNDGKIDSTLQNPIYTYTKPGNYTVKLTVTGPYYSSVKTLANLFTVMGPTNTRTGKVYETIQAAINDAADGDTIRIGSTSYLETYTENVNVNKRVDIIAQGKVIVTALNIANPVFNIMTDGSNSVINGFIITGAINSSGIYIAPSISSTITNNTITDNNIGINVDNGSSSIHFNNIYSNTMYGLKFTGNNVDASNNWWGTNKPTYKNGTTATSTVDIYEAQNTRHEVYNPWIVLNVTTSDDLLKNGDNATITVDMTHNSNGQDTSTSGSIPELPVSFNYTLGTFSTNITTVSRGKASITLTSGKTSGTKNLTATVSEYTITVPITVDTIAPNATASLTGGTFNSTQNVTLTTNDPTATIYYTTDTTDPRISTTRTQYTGNITINTTTALRYVAIDPAGNWSPQYVQNYVLGEQGLANSDWPSFQHDGNNTGQTNNTGPQTNSTKWTFNGLTVYGSAVIGSDNTIYVASYEGILYAFNPNGVLKWTWTTRSYILGSPVIGSNGSIYITNWMNSTTYAISPNGTLIWKYNTGDYGTCSPVISADGTIYIVTTNTNSSTLYALYPTGILKWTCTLGIIYGSSPVIGSEGIIYITDYEGLFYAVNTNGIIKWTYTLETSTTLKYGTEYSGISIGSDGTLYVGSRDGILYAINTNGTTKWTYRTYEFMHGVPAISSNGTIYAVGSSNLYAITDSGTSAILKWRYPTGGVSGNGATSAAIDSNGTIYVGSNNGVYAIKPDGTLLWKYTTDSIVGSPAIVSDGTIYIGTVNGTFYAFNDRAVDFTVERINGTTLTVQFNGSSTVTPVTSWKWYFGDGNTSTEQKPTYTYTKAGKYTIFLVATLHDGSTLLRQVIVNIEEMDITAPTVNTTLPSGTYNNTQTVTLTSTDNKDNTTVYYTTDGSDPLTSSTRRIYTQSITIYDSTTLKFAAVDSNGNWSPVYTESLTIINVIYVEDASNYNTSTINQDIQSILDNAKDGSVIVFKGTHYENLQLTLNKPLTIVSNTGTTIVTSSSGTAVFLINGNQASGSQIIGFNIITNTTTGILVNNTSNVTISNVQVTANGGTAISVNGSSNVNISNVSVTDSFMGIDVSNSSNIQINGSTVTGNNKRGINIYNSSNVTVASSIMNKNGKTVGTYSDEGAVYIESSDNITISNNSISDNDSQGVTSKNSSNITIYKNSIIGNDGEGILLTGSANNINITWNDIEMNANGVQIDYTSGGNVTITSNTIYGNVQNPNINANIEDTGNGINFGRDWSGTLATIEWNVIAGNDHRDIDAHDEGHYTEDASLHVGVNVYTNSIVDINHGFCCKIGSTAATLAISKMGNTYSTYFTYVDSLGNSHIITNIPSITVKVTINGVTYDVTLKDGVGSITVALTEASGTVDSEYENNKATMPALTDDPQDPSGSDPTEGFTRYSDGIGPSGGPGSNTGPGTLSGNTVSSGVYGSSSNSGSSSGTVALGSAAAASAAGSSSDSSSQGSDKGGNSQSKTVQELVMDELKHNSPFWGIIAIIILLVVVILAYYRKSIKSMVEKSKK